MAATALLLFSASALFLQTISGQYLGGNCGCLNNGYGNGLLGYGSGFGLGSDLGLGAGLGGLNSGFGYANSGLGWSNGLGNVANFGAAGLDAAVSGGALGVSSGSPIYPSGLAVQSENAIGGAVDVAGVLPFVSAVVVEGEVPSAGAAGVQYSCGNGNIGIVSAAPAGLNYGNGIGSGFGLGAGFGSGINGFGYGLGAGFGSGINGIGYGNALGGIRNSCGCAVY